MGSDESAPRALTERQVRDILDALEAARGITTRMPALPKGISSRHVRVIDQIERLGQKGPVRVSDVSEALHVTRPGITKAVNDLTERGYVAKRPDESDSRLVLLSLTELGRDLYERCVHGYQAQLAECWGEVPARDVQVMIHTMQRLLDLMP